MKASLVMISVRIRDGECEKRPVQAYVLGSQAFAIHKNYVDPRQWTLTHLGTGLAVFQRFATKSDADKVRLALEQDGINWRFTDVKAWNLEERTKAEGVFRQALRESGY